jgi:hypothetical protein
LILLSLGACSSPRVLEISASPVDKPNLTLPPVDEISMRRVEWIVINKDNFDSVKSRLESRGQSVALYALTGDGYSNLSLNLSDIRALVQQQQAIIVAYENYYKRSSEAIDNANLQIRNQASQINSSESTNPSWLSRINRTN